MTAWPMPSASKRSSWVVSHGFPRPGDPGKTKLIYQYNGTRDEAIAVINDVTGDIVTIYTTTSNDWAGCARSLQW